MRFASEIEKKKKEEKKNGRREKREKDLSISMNVQGFPCHRIKPEHGGKRSHSKRVAISFSLNHAWSLCRSNVMTQPSTP